HAIGDGVERRHAHRTLLAGFQQSGHELLALEPLARAVFLHDHVRNLVDAFVAREALAAVEAFAPPADGFAFLRLARVDDFVAELAAVRTLHRWLRLGGLGLGPGSHRKPTHAGEGPAHLRTGHPAPA